MIGARLDAIEADYLTASSITNLTLTQFQHNTRITQARTKADEALADIAALETAVAALPTTSSVEGKLSLAGGTMAGDIHLDGNRILGCPRSVTSDLTQQTRHTWMPVKQPCVMT